MSTNIRSLPGWEANVDTSGFSMWREHLLATGMETNTLCSQGLSSPVFREFITCFLFFNLSVTSQLCRTSSVSQRPLKCAELSLSLRVPHLRMPLKSVTLWSMHSSGQCLHWLCQLVRRQSALPQQSTMEE